MKFDIYYSSLINVEKRFCQIASLEIIYNTNTLQSAECRPIDRVSCVLRWRPGDYSFDPRNLPPLSFSLSLSLSRVLCLLCFYSDAARAGKSAQAFVSSSQLSSRQPRPDCLLRQAEAEGYITSQLGKLQEVSSTLPS